MERQANTANYAAHAHVGSTTTAAANAAAVAGGGIGAGGAGGAGAVGAASTNEVLQWIDAALRRRDVTSIDSATPLTRLSTISRATRKKQGDDMSFYEAVALRVKGDGSERYALLVRTQLAEFFASNLLGVPLRELLGSSNAQSFRDIAVVAGGSGGSSTGATNGTTHTGASKRPSTLSPSASIAQGSGSSMPTTTTTTVTTVTTTTTTTTLAAASGSNASSSISALSAPISSSSSTSALLLGSGTASALLSASAKSTSALPSSSSGGSGLIPSVSASAAVAAAATMLRSSQRALEQRLLAAELPRNALSREWLKIYSSVACSAKRDQVLQRLDFVQRCMDHTLPNPPNHRLALFGAAYLYKIRIVDIRLTDTRELECRGIFSPLQVPSLPPPHLGFSTTSLSSSGSSLITSSGAPSATSSLREFRSMTTIGSGGSSNVAVLSPIHSPQHDLEIHHPSGGGFVEGDEEIINQFVDIGSSIAARNPEPLYLIKHQNSYTIVMPDAFANSRRECMCDCSCSCSCSLTQLLYLLTGTCRFLSRSLSSIFIRRRTRSALT